MSNVSEIIVETLVKAGAKRCYGIVGDTINRFTDAVRRSDLVRVHVRHEEVGALVAGGDSYMTQELSVCAGEQPDQEACILSTASWKVIGTARR